MNIVCTISIVFTTLIYISKASDDVDLRTLVIPTTDLEYAEFERSQKDLNAFVKRTIETFEKRTCLPYVLLNQIFEFVSDSYYGKIVSKPESADPYLWVSAAKKMNLPMLFERASAKRRWKILILINRWIFKKYQSSFIKTQLNKRLALFKVIQMLLEIRDLTKKEWESNLGIKQEDVHRKFEKTRQSCAIYTIVTEMLGADGRSWPLEVNFSLFCADNILRWEQLHDGSVEESIEYLKPALFQQLSRIEKNDDYHYGLLRCFNREARRMDDLFRKNETMFLLSNLFKKLKITFKQRKKEEKSRV